MKRFLLSVAVAVIALPVSALQLERYNPLDFDIEEVENIGVFLTYTLNGGPCTDDPEKFRAHSEAIRVFGMPRFQDTHGDIIIPLVSYDNDYAEGWRLANDEVCLRYVTVLSGEAA